MKIDFDTIYDKAMLAKICEHSRVIEEYDWTRNTRIICDKCNYGIFYEHKKIKYVQTFIDETVNKGVWIYKDGSVIWRGIGNKPTVFKYPLIKVPINLLTLNDRIKKLLILL